MKDTVPDLLRTPVFLPQPSAQPRYCLSAIQDTLMVTLSGSDSSLFTAVMQPDFSNTFPYSQTLNDEPLPTSNPLSVVTWP